MDIELSPEAQRFIEAQLQQSPHPSAAEIIEALVREKQAEQACLAATDLAARQREKILRVIDECEALSPAKPGDGFSNREHDRALYGERR